MSLHPSREIGVQTIDPDSDQYFLKDSIIRYPSASTIRSMSASQQTLNTCSRGHFMEDTRPKYKGSRREEYGDHLEKHSSNLSDYYDRAPGSKKPTSILKSSSSLQKLNKDSFNESQQKVDRCKSGGSSRVRTEEIVILDDEDNNYEKSNKENTEKDQRKEKRELKVQLEKEREEDEKEQKKKQQLKLAAEDPQCPEGHVPMDEEERQSLLKIAQKRELISLIFVA